MSTISAISKPSSTKKLAERFSEIRLRTEEICKPLHAEDYVVQPVVDVSPPKWHLGHTTWFFENFILKEHLSGYRLFHSSYPYLFNSYYESQGERILRSNRGNMTRPSVEEVLKYRKFVDVEMLHLLEAEELDQEVLDFIEIGLQHEQQHQELLMTDLKYIFGHNPLFPAYRPSGFGNQQKAKMPESEWLKVQEGNYQIGFSGEGFAFDNERERHTVFLHSYAIMNRVVSNQEYLEFIEARGYKSFQFWLSEGWEWVNQQNVQAPLYWFKKDEQWWQFTYNGLMPLNLEEPVTHISFYEADAYSRWKGVRLPTEAEWEVACSLFQDREKENANFYEKRNHHPVYSDSVDFLGNSWEWTNSSYLPYRGYKQAEGALGEYNGKFMINQMVLRGGSCVTPESHIRFTYRNFFHPDKQWQFTGIRLAKDL